MATDEPMLATLRPHSVGSVAILAWGWLRIPLVVLVAYWEREPILGLIEQHFGIERVTHFAIAVLSTPLTRASATLLVVALLWYAWKHSSARLPVMSAYATTLGAGSVLIVALFVLTGTNLAKALPPILCLTLNLFPLAPGPLSGAWRRLMLWGVGIAEAMFFRRYMAWLSFAGQSGRLRSTRVISQAALADLPGIAMTGVLTALMLSSSWSIATERAVRMPAGVEILLTQDINGLALDSGGRHLYVTGHGLDRVQRIALNDAEQRPVAADVSTGGAQGLAYDPTAGEVHVINTYTRTLLSLDATTLALKRRVSLLDLSPGDPWLGVDAATKTLVAVSEADERVGSPFLVLDSEKGHVLDRRNLDAGNILIHPRESLIYLSFFRNSSSLMLYDLRRRDITATVPTDSRVDRMAIDSKRDELLLASPLRSKVLRFDAKTLEFRGEFDSVFAVRALAIDEVRGLLLSGSLATGQLGVMELSSGRLLRKIYLGPWLRSIVVDAPTGTAYASSNGALYMFDYVNRD